MTNSGKIVQFHEEPRVFTNLVETKIKQFAMLYPVVPQQKIIPGVEPGTFQFSKVLVPGAWQISRLEQLLSCMDPKKVPTLMEETSLHNGKFLTISLKSLAHDFHPKKEPAKFSVKFPLVGEKMPTSGADIIEQLRTLLYNGIRREFFLELGVYEERLDELLKTAPGPKGFKPDLRAKFYHLSSDDRRRDELYILVLYTRTSELGVYIVAS